MMMPNREFWRFWGLIVLGLALFVFACVMSARAKAAEPLELHAAVTAAARRHGVPVSIAHAVVRMESGYNCHARNSSGARGIMQLMPRTAHALGANASCQSNLDAGMKLLARIVHAHGVSCASLSLYERGEAAHPRCTSYGAKIMRLAARF